MPQIAPRASPREAEGAALCGSDALVLFPPEHAGRKRGLLLQLGSLQLFPCQGVTRTRWWL